MSATSALRWQHWAYLLLVALACLVWGAGSYGLQDNNEGLYVQIAREMHSSGDYVIPHLDGVPYLEKPPLLYYAVAATTAWFGNSAFAARLVPITAALGSALAVWVLAGAVQRRRSGWFAALILLSSLGFAALGRTVMPDMLLTCCLSWALVGLYLGVSQGRRGWMRCGYAALALAVLCKGFLALVIGAGTAALWLASSVRQEGWARWRILLDPWGLALLLIPVPWMILATRRNSDFAWFFFINENLLRFFGTREPHDYYGGPWWYYLPRLFIYVFPWSLLLPALFIPDRHSGVRRSDLQRFLWAGTGFSLVFFSLSSNKANYYLIIVAPLLALWLALRIDELLAAGRTRWLRVTLGLWAMVLIAAALWVQHLPPPNHERLTLPAEGRIVPTTWLLAGSALTAALLTLPTRPTVLRRTLLLLFPLLCVCLIGFGVRTLKLSDAVLSERGVARYLHRQRPHDRIYSFRRYEQVSSLTYYLGKPLGVVDSLSSDLYFISKTPYTDRFVTHEELRDDLYLRPFTLVVMDEDLPALRRSQLTDTLRPLGKVGQLNLFASNPPSAPPR